MLDQRHADSLPLAELILYRAAMTWLHLKDEVSYYHIRKLRRETGQGHNHRKSKTTELGRVGGKDIRRAYGSGPPLLQTQCRLFDGNEPDAEAAEAAGDAVAATARRPRKGGRVFLREALGDADGFTDIELAEVFVVSKKKPEHLHGLSCATRDGTRLFGINAIRKYLKGLRDACKAKRRRVESDGPAEGSDAGDDDEEATWERALAMAMEEEPASLG